MPAVIRKSINSQNSQKRKDTELNLQENSQSQINQLEIVPNYPQNSNLSDSFPEVNFQNQNSTNSHTNSNLKIQENQNLDYFLENSHQNSFSIGKLISLTLIILSLIFLVAGSWFGYQITTSSNKTTKENLSLMNLIPQVGRFFAGGRATLKGEETGRTNILLLGLDVEAGLTDSIMLVSYFHREKKITTLNIPRDFYVNIPGVVTEKINAIYPLAKAQKPNDSDYGAKVLSDFVAREFGIDVNYWAVTNFAGVREVIDTLGGVPVNVDNDFQDFEFPKDDYSGYMVPAPKFTKGVENMNGSRAMIYARSRHGTGNEGSDFARSRRQSIVLQAILEKIKSQGILGNLTQINNYLNILGNNLQTNMKTEEMLAFADISREIDLKTNFLRSNWNNSLEFLCDEQNDFGAYILTYGDESDCGYIAGTVKAEDSIYRGLARTFVQNILVQAESAKLFDLRILIIGNNSDQSLKVQTNLIKLGFKNVEMNNNYQKITKATVNSFEEVLVIGPENFQTNFAKIGVNFTYKAATETPNRVTLPQNNAEIVIWVE